MANFNFNKVILGGRLTSDPELKQTQSGDPYVSFSIAVNRRTSKDAAQQADFFNVTAWRTTAEFVARFFKKGSSICVVGRLQNRSWTDQQGQKRTVTDIVADEVNFVDSRGEGPSFDNAAQQTYTPNAYNAPSLSSNASETNFEEVASDDDLPF
ncbi:MAG: single-stranded DNA-binding protein [Clostridia bacterium]|nr:single-stranded DNA-binding protein [Clostridia bacterium]